jgi:hypothetical protein
MKKFGCWLLAGSILWLVPCIASAQEQSSAPPKVLVIMREFLKPGKTGATHEKSESAFVQAMTRAKWPTNYLGMTSLSGKSRALFFSFYASFEAWEKDTAAMGKNATLAAALDHAAFVDGELLDSYDQSVFVYNEEFSLRPKYADVAHKRAMEIAVYHVRPGHSGEWTELVKKVMAAYEKADPEAHWACFHNAYGGEGGTYIFITALKSASEIDASMEAGKRFVPALGEDGLKKLDELEASSVESFEHQLFLFNPKMSYVADEWIKADPDFWKPNSSAPAAKPAPDAKEKPAQ